MRKKRFSHIDLLEAIAIFFVLLYHSGLSLYNFLEKPDAVVYCRYFFRAILATCVPLFFFSNGYLLLDREFSLKKHLKKLLRIVLLTIFWGFAGAAISGWATGEPTTAKAIWAEFIQMSHKWDLHIFWFMGALAELYILFPALKALYDTHKRGLLILTLACLLFVFILPAIDRVLLLAHVYLGTARVNIIVPLENIFNPFHGQYDYALFYFCAGGLFHHVEGQIRAVPAVKRNLISAISILASCLLLSLFGVLYSKYLIGNLYDVVWFGYTSLPAVVCVISLYVLSLNYTADNRFIRFISGNTLGIYFTHFIFIHAIRPRLPIGAYLESLCFAILYAFLIECLGLAVCYVLRKSRFTRALISLS